MSAGHYVYILRDPREKDFRRSIFYVGKGARLRAAAHRSDALQALGIADDSTDVDTATIRAKEERLNEIRAAGLTEEIDVLVAPSGAPIAEDTAYAVESALIEVLGHGGLEGLTNQVAGHHLRLERESVFSASDHAAEVELPAGVAAVIVPVNGIWGGGDYAGTLVRADDEQIWENSRRTWSSFASIRQQTISDRAGTDNPVLLLALAKDPHGSKANMIVGAYPLTAVQQSDRDEDRKGSGQKGWFFERDEGSLEIQDRLVGNVLTVGGVPQSRPQDRSYIGSW